METDSQRNTKPSSDPLSKVDASVFCFILKGNKHTESEHTALKDRIPQQPSENYHCTHVAFLVLQILKLAIKVGNFPVSVL